MFERRNYAVGRYNLLIYNRVAACGVEMAVCGADYNNVYLLSIKLQGMEVTNFIAFHVFKNDIPGHWKIGDVLSVPKSEDEYNPYHKFFIDFNLYNYIGKYDELRNHLLRCCNGNEDAATQIYEAFLREVAFEEMRVKSPVFKGLPSRKHCLWCCKSESLGNWVNTFSDPERPATTIYELSLNGIIHEADEKYTHRLPNPQIHDYFGNAIKYWTGAVEADNPDTELLFVGQATVLNKYNSYNEWCESRNEA